MIVFKATNQFIVPDASDILRKMSTGYSVFSFIAADLQSTNGLFQHSERASYGTPYINPGLYLAGSSSNGGADEEDSAIGKGAVPVTVPFALAFGPEIMIEPTALNPS